MLHLTMGVVRPAYVELPSLPIYDPQNDEDGHLPQDADAVPSRRGLPSAEVNPAMLI